MLWCCLFAQFLAVQLAYAPSVWITLPFGQQEYYPREWLP
jgi:hypothetical protein